MSTALDATMVGIGCAGVVWLALLWVVVRLRIDPGHLAARLGFGVAAVLVLFMPIANRPLWSWVFGFCPNPSLPLLGLVCAGLWQQLCGVKVLSPAEWRQAWRFGAVAGTVLYVHPFCLPADLYNWGWRDVAVAWTTAGLAVLFLLWGSRVGVLFIAALVGFEAEALESHNGWDYVVDPFYWLTGCGVTLVHAAVWWGGRRRRAIGGQNEAMDSSPPQLQTRTAGKVLNS